MTLPKPLACGIALGLMLSSPVLAMNNPASAFCLDMGGKRETLKDASGADMSVCHLPDGRIIEEWTLFRMYHGKVPTGLLDGTAEE